MTTFHDCKYGHTQWSWSADGMSDFEEREGMSAREHNARERAYDDAMVAPVCPECEAVMQVEYAGHRGSRTEPPEPITLRCPKCGNETDV